MRIRQGNLIRPASDETEEEWAAGVLLRLFSRRLISCQNLFCRRLRAATLPYYTNGISGTNRVAEKKLKKRAPGAGHPPRMVACPNCGEQFGIRDLRKHLTDCREKK